MIRKIKSIYFNGRDKVFHEQRFKELNGMVIVTVM